MKWIIDNIDKPFPHNTEGNYFVWMSEKVFGCSYIQTACVIRGGNGLITIIGDYFANDILSKENFIVAWCEQPKTIEEWM